MTRKPTLYKGEIDKVADHMSAYTEALSSAKVNPFSSEIVSNRELLHIFTATKASGEVSDDLHYHQSGNERVRNYID